MKNVIYLLTLMLLHTLPFFSATQKVNSWIFWPIFGDSFAILQVFKSHFSCLCVIYNTIAFCQLGDVSWRKENWHEGEFIMTDFFFNSLKGRTEWRVKSCYSLCPSVGYKEVRLFSILHSQEVKQIHLSSGQQHWNTSYIHHKRPKNKNVK